MSKRARSSDNTPTKQCPVANRAQIDISVEAAVTRGSLPNEVKTEPSSPIVTTSTSQNVPSISPLKTSSNGPPVFPEADIPNWPIRRSPCPKAMTHIIVQEDITPYKNDSDSTSSGVISCPPTASANHQLSDFWKCSAPSAAGGRDTTSNTVHIVQDSTGAAGGTAPNPHHSSSVSSTSISNSKRQLQFLSLKDMQRLNETIQNQRDVIEALEKKHDQEREEIEQMRRQYEEARTAAQHQNNQLNAFKLSIEPLQSCIKTYRGVLRKVMIEAAIVQRREARRNEHISHFELGKVVMYPMGNGSRELWSEGNRFRDLIQKKEEIKTRMVEVEALRKRCEKASKKGGMIATIEGSVHSSNSATSSLVGPQQGACDVPECLISTTSGDDDAILMTKIEADGQVQMCRSEYERLTKALQDTEVQLREVQLHKAAFMKEMRRLQSEEVSKFAMIPTIHDDRYVMMNLLGKGGFSEVWRVFDVYEAKYCACKIHHISKEWTDATRDHYQKHAERELEIMRRMNHPRLTKLYDVFYLDKDTFVSVLELSDGCDLDTILKRQSRLPEKEAKMVMIQLIAALRHLAQQECPIIHYDLKPANILFHSSLPSCLDIKVTDFGLSKVMMERNHSDDPSIELTSQGTGTYWYLPPECFVTVPTPRITNKVDIWSAGVIFYQMLYGKRPFAEGESQRRIWSEKLILSGAHTLRFPDTVPPNGSSGGPAVASCDVPGGPVSFKVSDGAKSIIRACLEYDPASRIDIESLCTHSYFTGPKKKISDGSKSGHASTAAGTKSVTRSLRSSDRPYDRASDMPPIHNIANMPPPAAVRAATDMRYEAPNRLGSPESHHPI